MEFYPSPGNHNERAAHKKWCLNHNVDITGHITGESHCKRRWSKALINHYTWWRADRKGPIPALNSGSNVRKVWSERSPTSGNTKQVMKEVRSALEEYAGGKDEVGNLINDIRSGENDHVATITADYKIACVAIRDILATVSNCRKPGSVHNTEMVVLQNDLSDIIMELPVRIRKNVGVKKHITRHQVTRSNKRMCGKLAKIPLKQGRRLSVETNPNLSTDWGGYLSLSKNTKPGRRNVFDDTGPNKAKIPIRNIKRPMDDIARDFVKQRATKRESPTSKSWLKEHVPRHIKPPSIESFICPFCKSRKLLAGVMNKMLKTDAAVPRSG